MKQETVEKQEIFENESNDSKYVGGFLLILGVIFFLGVSEVSILGFNPWLLVALIPFYWIVVAAYKSYREDGRISRRVYSIAIFGLLPFAYIAASALGLNAGAIWPIGLIAVGAAFLLYGGSK
jgi:hypothetical protein